MELTNLYNSDFAKIYAIGSDMNLSDDEIRLLMLIHMKVLYSGFESIETPTFEEIQAVKIMLGDSEQVVEFLSEQHKLDNQQKENLDKSIKDLSDCIKTFDVKLQQEQGIEKRLTTELKYRLLFLTDEVFRKKTLKLYKVIEPKIKQYDVKKVKKSFSDYRERMAKSEDELNESLE